VPKFKKKPVVIEAWQWKGKLPNSIPSWMHEAFGKMPGELCQSGIVGDTVVIHTLEGDMAANPGDWIIQGVKGEIYPCKPNIFEATYELVKAGV